MFTELQNKVLKRFEELQKKGEIFQTDVKGDDIWNAYLNTFTDPAEKQHHNCNCCKGFLRKYGNLVSIEKDTGKVHFLWDFSIKGKYSEVPVVLQALVSSSKASKPFYTSENTLGVKSNLQATSEGSVIQWNHFYLKPPASSKVSSYEIGSLISSQTSLANVGYRSLTDITLGSVDKALSLISANALPRGSQFKSQLVKFKKVLEKFQTAPEELKMNFAWANRKDISGIRNQSIGTFLLDLSEGVDLERALSSFSDMVSGQNYQRTTASVSSTKLAMFNDMMERNGYSEASFEMTHCSDTDIDVNDTLFMNVDSSGGSKSLGSLLEDEVVFDPKMFKKKVQDITFEDFKEKVIPSADNIQVLFEGNLKSHLCSTLRMSNPEKSIFKWGNPFSYSYRGGYASAITERVKSQGGVIDADVRVSLAWDYICDLDLSCVHEGHVIDFSNKGRSGTQPCLDVDMNAHSYRCSEDCVENIFVKNYVKNGSSKKYTYKIHNYNKRQSAKSGCKVEVSVFGETQTYEFKGLVPTNKPLDVLEVVIGSSGDVDVSTLSDKLQLISSNSQTQEEKVWGLSMNKFHDISMMLKSPNQWKASEDKSGLDQTFLILKGANCSEELSGFYSELLSNDFRNYKGVVETITSKMKVTPSKEQLSGLGFSSDNMKGLILKVNSQGSQKTYKIV